MRAERRCLEPKRDAGKFPTRERCRARLQVCAPAPVDVHARAAGRGEAWKVMRVARSFGVVLGKYAHKALLGRLHGPVDVTPLPQV